MADAARHLGAVALDLHPAAAPVAELAALHVAPDRLWIERQARGQAFDDARQARAVGLAGSDEAEGRHASPHPIAGQPPQEGPSTTEVCAPMSAALLAELAAALMSRPWRRTRTPRL